jgi:hypothetical protein
MGGSPAVWMASCGVPERVDRNCNVGEGGGNVSCRMLQTPQPTVPLSVHGSCEYSRPVYSTAQACTAN